MKRYMILDTETSGFGNSDAVLQIAFQVYSEGGTLLHEGRQYFNHSYEYEISEGALKVNGLTKEFLATKGISGDANIKMALSNLGYMIDRCDLFIAHNVSFDWRMLQNEWARYGLFQDTQHVKTTTFCTQNDPAIKAFVGARDKNNNIKAPKLAELHQKLFGEEFDGAHDALADVKATAKCFFELVARKIIDIGK
jgi:DNA polymerase III epsilon subunit-like protein